MSVLFGGSDQFDVEQSETWEYNGTNWSQASPTTSPAARSGHSLAFNSGDNKVYLFGGNADTTYFSDLWTYDGTTWTELTPSTAPPARSKHGMAIGNGQILIFGGRTAAGTLLGDTWVYDIATNSWSEVSGAGPEARMKHSIVYDVANSEFVMMAGTSDADDIYLTDTWRYATSGGWESITRPGPDFSKPFRVVYDDDRSVIVLFSAGETWEFK
ncbi:MAG: kelch repeat-containing protein [Chloroflexota bacterium]